MKKIAAFFDIDGTIYRDSLLLEHFRKLIKYDILPKDTFSKELESLYVSWLNRHNGYDDYLFQACGVYQEALIGISDKDIQFVAEKVIKDNSDRVYTYTRDRIKWHQSKGHLVIFISGSPDFLVSKMASKYGATTFAGSKYEMVDGFFTGNIIPMWDSVSKNKEIDNMVSEYDIDLSKSYAYGDTNGDFAMLNKVGNPIAVNPSKELIVKLSNSLGNENLKIAIERKDVIYILDKNLAYIK